MRERSLRGIPIGTLRDDLSEVANVAAHVCCLRVSTIWVDHLDVIHVDSPSKVSHAPIDWVVGTYNHESDHAQIEQDLRAMRRSSFQAEGAPRSEVLSAALEIMRRRNRRRIRI